MSLVTLFCAKGHKEKKDREILTSFYLFLINEFIKDKSINSL